jgi:hypothetical protein
MKSALFCFRGGGVSSARSPAVLAAACAARPNLVFILSDDVGQGDRWGEGGEGQKTTQEAGGDELPAAWVNVVHRTQTAHHPDPYDPKPSKRDTINYAGPLTDPAR